MSVLIFLCFVLFLIICVWNIYLTMQLSKYKEIEQSLFRIKQETEDVLYSFIEEWKDENEQFLNKLSKNSNTNKHAIKSTNIENKIDDSIKKVDPMIETRFDFIEKSSEIDYKDLLNDNLLNEEIESKVNVHSTTKEMNHLVNVNSSFKLVDEIMLLQKNGLTTAEIAKKLNKGKTEIELMLKLRQ